MMPSTEQGGAVDWAPTLASGCTFHETWPTGVRRFVQQLEDNKTEDLPSSLGIPVGMSVTLRLKNSSSLLLLGFSIRYLIYNNMSKPFPIFLKL